MTQKQQEQATALIMRRNEERKEAYRLFEGGQIARAVTAMTRAKDAQVDLALLELEAFTSGVTEFVAQEASRYEKS